MIARYGAVGSRRRRIQRIGRWGRRARLSCEGFAACGGRCRGKVDVGLDCGTDPGFRSCRMDRHIQPACVIVRSYAACVAHATYDEGFTFNPVRQSPGVHYLDFLSPLPKNHVLHTLLVRLAVALFGGSPVAIRLPLGRGGARCSCDLCRIAAACLQWLLRFYRAECCAHVSITSFCTTDGQRLQPIGPARLCLVIQDIGLWSYPIVEHQLCCSSPSLGALAY